MKLYDNGCCHIAEIPFDEIKKIDFATCKEPRETLASFYNREKPDVLINGGFFNMSNGNPVMDFKDENVIKSHEGWLSNGIGVIGSKILKWSTSGVLKEARDYISAYPPLVENGKATKPTYNAWTVANRATLLGYNDTTLFLVCADTPGVTMKGAQELMIKLGCIFSINLDGGGSTHMLYKGERVTQSGYNRAVDNVVAIYLNPTETPQNPIVKEDNKSMNLKNCFLINNRCYQKNQKMNGNNPTGIVVHSTGANNKTLKRYVQPVVGQDNYNEVMNDLGKNLYNNHWNMSSVSTCVHAFIGINANGKVETYQTLPWDVCCWGCGSGKNGSYNYNPSARVQFEICEDDLTDIVYFNAAMKEAQELCAYLCNKYGFGVDKICSHYESYYAGYGSNHGDPDHWLKKFGKNMDWFRSEVKKILNNSNAYTTVTHSVQSDFKVGDLVNIASDAVYYTGGSIPNWVKSQKWYVSSVNGDRIVLGKNESGNNSINSPVNSKYLSVVQSQLSIGDTVKMSSDALVYGTAKKFASWVYTSKLYVREINGDKIVVSTLKTGSVTGPVDKKYLTKV